MGILKNIGRAFSDPLGQKIRQYRQQDELAELNKALRTFDRQKKLEDAKDAVKKLFKN